MGCGGRDGGGCLYTVIQWKTNSHGIPLLVLHFFTGLYIIYTDGVAIQLVCVGLAQACPNYTVAYFLIY